MPLVAPEIDQVEEIADGRTARQLVESRSRETRWLWPDTKIFQAAPKGQSCLRSDGEVVIDPDFAAEWKARQADA